MIFKKAISKHVFSFSYFKPIEKNGMENHIMHNKMGVMTMEHSTLFFNTSTLAYVPLTNDKIVINQLKYPFICIKIPFTMSKPLRTVLSTPNVEANLGIATISLSTNY